MSLHPHDRRYRMHAYRSLPITFTRRVLLGRDPYWRRYFWNRWGYVGPSLDASLTGRPVLWLDALSGGEVTQAVTFCRALRAALPDWTIILSTNNKYSFDFAVAHLAVDAVFDTPWDCPAPMRRALRRIRPAAWVCIQLVYCPLLIRELRRAGVPTFLVSGLMSKGIHLHPSTVRAVELNPYGDLDWIGARTDEDAAGFIARGANPGRVQVTGNMKFDLEFLRVSDADRRRLAESLHLVDGDPVLLAASVNPGEEALAGRAYLKARRTALNLRLIVVPRYQFDVDQMMTTLAALGLSPVRRTELDGVPADRGFVVVVDTFGELNRLYAIATAVFLGGTMYRRNVSGFGQNPIEALAHRKALFFGPFMNLWREITDELKAVWPAVEISSADDLAAGVVAVLSGDPSLAALGRAIDRLLTRHEGDVQRNVELVRHALLRTVAVTTGDRPQADIANSIDVVVDPGRVSSEVRG